VEIKSDKLQKIGSGQKYRQIFYRNNLKQI
jgi:hypothetical protein